MKLKPKPRMKMKMTKKQTNMWQSRLHSRVTRTVENLTPTFLQQFLSPTFFFLLTFSNLFFLSPCFHNWPEERFDRNIFSEKNSQLFVWRKKIHNIFAAWKPKLFAFSPHVWKKSFLFCYQMIKSYLSHLFFLAINNSKWQN